MVSEFHHEYVSQDGFDAAATLGYATSSSATYHNSMPAADRYAARGSDRYLDEERSYRSVDKERSSRDRYGGSSRYEKERSSKHHHYHRSGSGRHESSSRERSRERTSERRHERDYDRSRDRDRHRRSEHKSERDYRDRERDRSRDRSRTERERERSKDRRYAREPRDYIPSADAGGGGYASAVVGVQSSSSSSYYLNSHAGHVNSGSSSYGSYHHSYGYAAVGTESTSWSSSVGGHQKTSWPPAPQAHQPAPPPPPPDATPNWDEPEPPEAEETSYAKKYNSNSAETFHAADAEDKKSNKTSADCKTEADMTNVDLDTRIAMMFKGKSAPPFLQMDSSESDNEKPAAETEDGELPSESQSDKRKRNRSSSDGKNSYSSKSKTEGKSSKKAATSSVLAHQGTSDISSSDDDILLKKDSYSPILPGHLKKEEDGMSLSSLSSHEGGVHQRLEAEPPPLAGTAASSLPPAAAAAYVYPAAAAAASYYYPGYTAAAAGPPNAQYFPNPAYMQSSYLPGFAGFGDPAASYNAPYSNAYKYNSQRGSSFDYRTSASASSNYATGYSDYSYSNDPYKKPIEEVVKRVSDELKQILKRDFNKKMIENTAYKNFESWWDEQLKKSRHKDRKQQSSDKINSSVLINASNSTAAPTTNRLDKPPDINQLINSHCDISDFNSYTSLGLRASIPKLPSFRRIRKAPSPKKKEDDDKHLSDQEEMVQGSDSEKEDNSNLNSAERNGTSAATLKASVAEKDVYRQRKNSRTNNATAARRLKRKGSSSSFFSSSEEDTEKDEEEDEEDEADSSSSDSDSSDDDLSSASETDLNKKVKEKRRIKHRQSTADVYTDSEEENKKSAPHYKTAESNKKSNIYSDSEEDSKTIGKSNQKADKFPSSIVDSDLEDISKDSTLSLECGDNAEQQKEAEIKKEPPLASEEQAIKQETLEIKKESTESLENAATSLQNDLIKTETKCESTSAVAKQEEEEEDIDKKKSAFDRIYSDSEEEREYQERRRRNTEYMAQIEREFQEEQERKMREAAENPTKVEAEPTEIKSKTDNKPAALSFSKRTNSTSLDMPNTPDINKIPPTPGARLNASDFLGLSDKTAANNKKEKSSTKAKKEKVAAASKTNKKDSKIGKKQQQQQQHQIQQQLPYQQQQQQMDAFSALDLLATSALEQHSNGYGNQTKSTAAIPMQTTTASNADDLHDNLKLSPTSSDGGSSQASQASQVALEHCYSLPPEADVNSTSNSNNYQRNGETNAKKQAYLTHDHGGYATPPQQQQQQSQQPTPAAVINSKPGPGRPRKDSAANTTAGRVSKKIKEEQQMERHKAESKMLVPAIPAPTNFVPMQMFKPRESAEELRVLYEFLTKGIDAEDIQYMRRSYEMHLQEDTYG